MNRWWLVYVVVLGVLVSGCMGSQASDERPDVSHLEPQLLTEMMQEAGVTEVDSLEIQSGSTGEKKRTTDSALIENFMSQIAEVIYTPDPNQEERIGWIYRVTVKDDDNSFEFYPHYVEDVYYKADGDVGGMMEALFQEIEKQEPVGAGWYPIESPPTLEIRVGSEKIHMELGSYQWSYVKEGTEEVLNQSVEARMASFEDTLARANPPKVHMNLMTDVLFGYRPQSYKLTLWKGDHTMVSFTSLEDLKNIGPVVVQVWAAWEQGHAMYYGVMDIQ